MISEKKLAQAHKAAPVKNAAPATQGNAALKAVGKPAAPPSTVKAEVLAGVGMVNEKQARARRNGATESNLQMRAHLWPALDEKRLWLRTDKTRKGFATMPRTMALIVNLIDDISKQATGGKAVPAGRT